MAYINIILVYQLEMKFQNYCTIIILVWVTTLLKLSITVLADQLLKHYLTSLVGPWNNVIVPFKIAHEYQKNEFKIGSSATSILEDFSPLFHNYQASCYPKCCTMS